MKILRNTILIFLFAIICYSCNHNTIYQENITVKNAVWNWKQRAQFAFDVKDTITPNDIIINLRNTGEYKYSNIYLFIKLIAPSGASVLDTFNCVLANEKGKWLGRGSGDLWEHQILWKKDVIFPHSGKYKVEIVQAMRDKQLAGITDVGVSVVKAI